MISVFVCMTEELNSILSFNLVTKLLSEAKNCGALSLCIFMYVHMYIHPTQPETPNCASAI